MAEVTKKGKEEAEAAITELQKLLSGPQSSFSTMPANKVRDPVGIILEPDKED